MTANAPKPGRDELFIVLLEVLRLSPGRLLVVCIGFKYKTSNINTNGHIIAHAKGGAQTSWRRIDQPDREADKSNPSRCEKYKLSCEGESHVLLPWPNQEREYMRGCFLISSKRESPPDLIARYRSVSKHPLFITCVNTMTKKPPSLRLQIATAAVNMSLCGGKDESEGQGFCMPSQNFAFKAGPYKDMQAVDIQPTEPHRSKYLSFCWGTKTIADTERAISDLARFNQEIDMYMLGTHMR